MQALQNQGLQQIPICPAATRVEIKDVGRQFVAFCPTNGMQYPLN